jgi:hypothetical protein
MIEIARIGSSRREKSKENRGKVEERRDREMKERRNC